MTPTVTAILEIADDQSGISGPFPLSRVRLICPRAT